ncbi:MAG: hypothetical protein ACK5IQ_09270 [Bacteroidales bacterium]
MKQNKENQKKPISRRETLKAMGIVVAGGAIAALAGKLLKSESKPPECITEAERNSIIEDPDAGYIKLSTFRLKEKITRFALAGDNIIIAAGQKIYVCSENGEQQEAFHIKENLRDLTIDKDEIYALYPNSIEVYKFDGQQVRQWEACDNSSDYCSLTIAKDNVFVSDSGNKNICKYTTEGNFLKFISSPKGFIIPSFLFDIASYNDEIYCVNSGRHKIEVYTLDGEFVRDFGKPGTEAGAFAGCCNPAYMTISNEGQMLVSEKGIPRISMFERNGTFDEVLMNSTSLGGGTKPYGMRIANNKLYISNRKTMKIMQRMKV